MAGSARQSACHCCSGRGRPPCLAGSACPPRGGLGHHNPEGRSMLNTWMRLRMLANMGLRAIVSVGGLQFQQRRLSLEDLFSCVYAVA